MSPKCFCRQKHSISWDFSAALALAVQSVHVALYTPSCSVGPTEAVWNTSAVPVYDVYMHRTVYDGWPVFHNTYDAFCFRRNTIKLQETKPISFYCHPSPCKYQITGWIVSKCLTFKIAVWCWESTSWDLSSIPRNREENLTVWFWVVGEFHTTKKFNKLFCLGIRIEFPTGFCQPVLQASVKQLPWPWPL